MTANIIITVAAGLLGAGFMGFIQFLITRKDNRADRLGKIEKKLDSLEKGSLRTQMLVLMTLFPGEKSELMKVAEHYFAELHGDWYMTGIFNKHLEDEGIAKPDWFDTER